MFTGIVEEIGQLKEIKQVSEHAIQMKIQAEEILVDVRIGDSIAVNGVCLTVTNYEYTVFYVDVMPETIYATSLKDLTAGSYVNLERALQAKDRFGGHFVTGHVDGIGTIVRKEQHENAFYYDVQMTDNWLSLMTKKGSVAIDGVSLTVFNTDRRKGIITLSLIPHTMAATVLGNKRINDTVNIECDMLAKYVQHHLALYVNSSEKAGK